MDEVLRLRHRIDEIDQEIIQLLKSRSENARLLGRIKKARGLTLRDFKRESAILHGMERVAEKLDLEPALVQTIFKRILRLSVHSQKEPPEKPPGELEGLRVLIAGGTGGMGRFLALLVRLHGGSVKIIGRDASRTRKAAREMEVRAGSAADVKTSDIVIVATPMEATLNVALKLAEEMKEGALLTDLSSVKTGIADVIASRIPSRIEFVSIHPLFSPRLDHAYGQTVLAIPFKVGPMWERFSKTMETAGARLETCSLGAHDRIMSYVQVMHHFALITLGVSLGKWDGKAATNSLRISEDRIRSLLQNWRTVVGIQQLNPNAQSARSEFVATARRLEKMDLSIARFSMRSLQSHVRKWSRKI